MTDCRVGSTCIFLGKDILIRERQEDSVHPERFSSIEYSACVGSTCYLEKDTLTRKRQEDSVHPA